MTQKGTPGPSPEKPVIPAQPTPPKIPVENPGQPEVKQPSPQPEIVPNRSQPEVELPPRRSTK